MEAKLARYEDFVPECVIRQLAKTKKLGDEVKVPSFKKSDISGYTNLSEKVASRGARGAEDISIYLNSYWESLVRITTKSGGDVFKYWSSETVEEWDLKTTLHRAVQCALDIQKELHNYKIGEGVVFRVKCGIGCGKCYVLYVGGVLGRLEYLLCGPALLAAFDCEEQCGPGDVVVSLDSWHYLSDCMKGTTLPLGCVKILNSTQQIRLISLKREKHEEILSDMQKFVAAAVIPYMQKDAAYWAAEVRTMTILFVNVGLKASKLIEIKDMQLKQVQDVLVAVQASLYDYEGSLNKFLVDDKGSTLLAVFGLPPLAHEDDPTRAVLSALTLVSRLESLGYRPYVGITTGIAHCGCLGAGSRKEYGVLGDVVNTAARLMQNAQKLACKCRDKSICPNILIDKTTKNSADSYYQLKFKANEPINLKGKSEAVEVFYTYYPDKSIERTFTLNNEIDNNNLILTAPMKMLISEIKRQLYKLVEEIPESCTLIVTGDTGTGKSLMIQTIANALNKKNEKSDLTCIELESFIINNNYDLVDAIGDTYSMNTRCYIYNQLIHKIIELVEDEDEKKEYKDEIKKHNLFLPISPIDVNEDIMKDEKEISILDRILYKRTKPLIIIIDQGQYMNEIDWKILYNITTSPFLRVKPILTIISCRPLHNNRYTPIFTPVSQYYFNLLQSTYSKLIELYPLKSDDVNVLIQKTLDVKVVAESIKVLVNQFTGGNPLYVSRFIRTLLNNKWIQVVKECNKNVLKFNDQRIQHDVPYNFNIPYKITRGISTYLDKLKPMEFLLLKTAAVVSFTGGCLSGTFELALVATIFPKKSADSNYANNFMDYMNTLQYFNLVEPSIPHEIEMECPHTYIVSENIKPLQGRCYKFTAIVIRDIIYQRVLFEQRKRIHKSVADYFFQQLSNLDGFCNEFYRTVYSIHYYRHILQSEDINIANKVRCKLLGSCLNKHMSARPSAVNINKSFHSTASVRMARPSAPIITAFNPIPLTPCKMQNYVSSGGNTINQSPLHKVQNQQFFEGNNNNNNNNNNTSTISTISTTTNNNNNINTNANNNNNSSTINVNNVNIVPFHNNNNNSNSRNVLAINIVRFSDPGVIPLEINTNANSNTPNINSNTSTSQVSSSQNQSLNPISNNPSTGQIQVSSNIPLPNPNNNNIITVSPYSPSNNNSNNSCVYCGCCPCCCVNCCCCCLPSSSSSSSKPSKPSSIQQLQQQEIDEMNKRRRSSNNLKWYQKLFCCFRPSSIQPNNMNFISTSNNNNLNELNENGGISEIDETLNGFGNDNNGGGNDNFLNTFVELSEEDKPLFFEDITVSSNFQSCSSVPVSPRGFKDKPLSPRGPGVGVGGGGGFFNNLPSSLSNTSTNNNNNNNNDNGKNGNAMKRNSKINYYSLSVIAQFNNIIHNNDLYLLQSIGYTSPSTEIRYLYSKINDWDFDVYSASNIVSNDENNNNNNNNKSKDISELPELKRDNYNNNENNSNNKCTKVGKCESNSKLLKFVTLSILQKNSVLDLIGVPFDYFNSFLDYIDDKLIKSSQFNMDLRVADVIQTINCLLINSQLYSIFKPKEIFILYLSALIKDISHPSYLYRALRNARDNLLDYRDREHQETVDLSILYDEFNNGKCILSFFSEEDKKYIDKLIHRLVLGSCLHNHTEFINRFNDYFPNKKPIYDSEENKFEILLLIFKTSILNNPVKPFPIYKTWFNSITETEITEEDLKRNSVPNCEMNGDLMDISDIKTFAHSQLEYMRLVVHPLFYLLFDYFPSIRDLCRSSLISNYSFWTTQEKSQSSVAGGKRSNSRVSKSILNSNMSNTIPSLNFDTPTKRFNKHESNYSIKVNSMSTKIHSNKIDPISIKLKPPEALKYSSTDDF